MVSKIQKGCSYVNSHSEDIEAEISTHVQNDTEIVCLRVFFNDVNDSTLNTVYDYLVEELNLSRVYERFEKQDEFLFVNS